MEGYLRDPQADSPDAGGQDTEWMRNFHAALRDTLGVTIAEPQRSKDFMRSYYS